MVRMAQVRNWYARNRQFLSARGNRRGHEDGHCQQKRGLAPLVSTPVSARSQQDQLHLCARLPQVARGFPSWSVQAVPPAATEADVRNTRLQHIHESNLAGAGNGMGDCTRSPLNRRVSRTDTANGVERSGSNDSGGRDNVPQPHCSPCVWGLKLVHVAGD